MDNVRAAFFQFPQSERVNCNWQDMAVSASHVFLSVSTIGTSELQHFVQVLRTPEQKSFQFPQSERVNCNGIAPPIPNARRVLSVSTIGTSELQLSNRERECKSRHLSVSTIGTSELQRTELGQRALQTLDFQFPQSERVNCNASVRAAADVATRSFSFHNRNE